MPGSLARWFGPLGGVGGDAADELGDELVVGAVVEDRDGQAHVGPPARRCPTAGPARSAAVDRARALVAHVHVGRR